MRIFTENIVSGKYRVYSENLINEAASFSERRAAIKGDNKNTTPQKPSEPAVSSEPKKSPGSSSFAERRAASKSAHIKPTSNNDASEPVVSSEPKKSSSAQSFSERRAAAKGVKNPSEELSDGNSIQEEPRKQEIDNSPEGKLKRYLDRKRKEREEKEDENKGKISVDSKEELQDEILRIAEENPNKVDIDLNCLDVSDIDDFSYLFSRYYGERVIPNNQRMRGSSKESKILQKLNPKVETWDVSSAKTTDFMFAFSKFNGDISQWYFSYDWKSADSMFMSSDFSGKNLNNNSGIMDISNLKVASYMFSNCKNLNADFTNMKKPEVIDFNDEGTYRGNFDSMFSNSPNATPPDWIRNLIIDED